MRKYRLHEKAWKNRDAWKLANENWNTVRQIIILRDGDKCAICNSEENLQLDHCFSRKCRKLFFDSKNLNLLCKECHSHKSFNGGSWLDKKVDEITRERAGEAWWQWALQISKEICGEWKTVYHQEEIKFKLIDELFKQKERA